MKKIVTVNQPWKKSDPQPILLPGYPLSSFSFRAVAASALTEPVTIYPAFPRRTCSSCSAPFQKGDRFCGWCGTRLSED